MGCRFRQVTRSRADSAPARRNTSDAFRVNSFQRTIDDTVSPVGVRSRMGTSPGHFLCEAVVIIVSTRWWELSLKAAAVQTIPGRIFQALPSVH